MARTQLIQRRGALKVARKGGKGFASRSSKVISRASSLKAPTGAFSQNPPMKFIPGSRKGILGHGLGDVTEQTSLTIAPPLDPTCSFSDLRTPRQWHQHIMIQGGVLEVDIASADVSELLMYVDSLVHYGDFSRLMREFDVIYARSSMVGRHCRSLFRSRRGRRALKGMTAAQLLQACQTKLRPTIFGLLSKLGDVGREVCASLPSLCRHEEIMVLGARSDELFSQFFHSLPKGSTLMHQFNCHDHQFSLIFDFILEERLRGNERRLPFVRPKLIYRLVAYLFKNRRADIEDLLYTIRPCPFREHYTLNRKPYGSSCRNHKKIYSSFSICLIFRQRLFFLGLQRCLPVIKRAIIKDIQFWETHKVSQPSYLSSGFGGVSAEYIPHFLLRYLHNYPKDLLEAILGESVPAKTGFTLANRYSYYSFNQKYEQSPHDPAVYRESLSSIKRGFLQRRGGFLPPPGYYASDIELSELGIETSKEITFGSHVWITNELEALFFAPSSMLFHRDERNRNQAFALYTMYAFASNDPDIMHRYTIFVKTRGFSLTTPQIRSYLLLLQKIPITEHRLAFLRMLFDSMIWSADSILSLLFNLSVEVSQELIEPLISFVSVLLLKANGTIQFPDHPSILTDLQRFPDIPSPLTRISRKFFLSRYSPKGVTRQAVSAVYSGFPIKSCGIIDALFPIAKNYLSAIANNSYDLHSPMMSQLITYLFVTYLQFCDPKMTSPNQYYDSSGTLLSIKDSFDYNYSFFEKDEKVQTSTKMMNFLSALTEKEFKVLLDLIVRFTKQESKNYDLGSLIRLYQHCYRSEPLRHVTENNDASLPSSFLSQEPFSFREFEIQTRFEPLPECVSSFLTKPVSCKRFKKHHCRHVLPFCENHLRVAILQMRSQLEAHVEFSEKKNELDKLLRSKEDPSEETKTRIEVLTAETSNPTPLLLSFDPMMFVRLLEMGVELHEDIMNTILNLLFCTPKTYKPCSAAYSAAAILYHTNDDIKAAIWERFTENTWQSSLALNTLLKVASNSSQSVVQEIVDRANRLLQIGGLGLVVTKQLTRLTSALQDESDTIETLYSQYYSDGLGIGLRSTVIEQIWKLNSKQYFVDASDFPSSRLCELLEHALENYGNIQEIQSFCINKFEEMVKLFDGDEKALILEKLILALFNCKRIENISNVLQNVLWRYAGHQRILTYNVTSVLAEMFCTSIHFFAFDKMCVDDHALDGFREFFAIVSDAFDAFNAHYLTGEEISDKIVSLCNGFTRGCLRKLNVLPEMNYELFFKIPFKKASITMFMHILIQDQSLEMEDRVEYLKRFVLHPETSAQQHFGSYPEMNDDTPTFDDLLKVLQAFSDVHPQLLPLLLSYFTHFTFEKTDKESMDAFFNFVSPYVYCSTVLQQMLTRR